MRKPTHGMTKTRQYRIWAQMKQRCETESNVSYEYCGGKGITVCDKWQKFSGFWEDMKDGYAENLTIDRIENDKPYCKENCRWATRKIQDRNRTDNHRLTYNGRTQTLTDWAEEFGINPKSLSWRIFHGWSTEEAINTPYNGKTKKHGRL